jgi:succinyl-CoA synthetase beta subunit
LFAEYGIPVPAGHVANTPQEAAEATTKLGGAAVVKGQVLTGGRGKAGAVKVVDSPEQAEQAAAKILQLKVKDIPVEKVLVSEKMDIRDEYYAAITVDRDSKSIVLIFSDAGGVDIEETAAKTPEKIRQLALAGDDSVNTQQMLDWLSTSQAVSICGKMFRLFREKDCSLVEINPLAVVGTGEMIALDAKLVVDDNAMIRHPELEDFRNPEEYTHE